MEISELIFLLTKEMQIKFCMCDLAFGNMCYNPKRPVTKYKAYNSWLSKLYMACVCVCARAITQD